MSNNNWGGSRPNSGRPKGSISLLISVVKDNGVPIGTRVQACNSALKYLYPPAQVEGPGPESHQVQITGFEVVCEDDG
ncbi:MAG TPA: hypothetical protein EYQ26_12425 [Rhodospirillales bacterium]|nr:hypothetical protein [Rhodospirillales bacterium]